MSRYTPEDFARDTNVSRETLGRLRVYADLLTQWQKAINLVGPATLPDLWHRHMLDSAQLLPVAQAADHVVAMDLGSGAGFPGLVLAIMGLGRWTLVESDQRKATFLREVIRATGAPAAVVAKRIESLPDQQVGLITARALAPLPRILPLLARFCGPETVVLLPKGREADSELAEARAAWDFQVTASPSKTAVDATLLRLTGLTSTHGDTAT